ncbi:MAG: hypothetical protein L3K26_15020, partial [Candidatus Hydrogenedentes bacterium]|nr:hypothetical protein [Candidatus Hydrogenedentota bacterium]
MRLPLPAILFALCFHAALAHGAGMSLSFWDEGDITDPFGPIRFGGTPLENEGRAEGYPDMQYGCAAPGPDGATWIYGWRIQNWSDTKNRVIQVVRCTTRDGRSFAGEEVVFEYTRSEWQGFANIVYRPTDGAVYLFSWAEWPGKLHVFRSETGTDWELLTGNAFEGHDASCFFWHAPTEQFVVVQTIVQPYPKRYPDNIGELRRVLSFMRSKDGVAWETFSPDFLGGDTLWTPDEADPADLEFYRVVAFPVQGRYAMLLNDYMPPPSEANSRRAATKHGPPYMTEWAISRDGLNWARPFRETNVYEDQFWLALQGPLAREGRLRFYHPDGRIASLPEDRLFYVTCRANGEFSTPGFSMPAGGLTLNADASYLAAEGANGRAYIMADLLDDTGAIIPGYEREKCLYENVNGHALPMRWGDKDGSDVAGQTVQLRFFLR